MSLATNSELPGGEVEVVSADWAGKPRKRAVYTARRRGPWVVAREEPPAQGWSLGALLELATGLRARRRPGAQLAKRRPHSLQ